jgi:hypothetical protein
MDTRPRGRDSNYYLDKETLLHWVKYNERPIFKATADYILKLEKANEQYTINWLGDLSIVVTSSRGIKEFPYKTIKD